MFAGAAREAVFSKPEVVEKINAEFIPVALKAAHVNNPQPGPEGQMFREIGRSKIAPQGICVVNSACKVLSWSVSFDEDDSIEKFLDHCVRRYDEFPNAETPVAAERYRKFPSLKMADVADDRSVPVIPEQHRENDPCPGEFRYPPGTFLARVVGRLLDDDGGFSEATRTQDNYIEDRFEIGAAEQRALLQASAAAGAAAEFDIPTSFARAIVGASHLGQLDVSPLGGSQTGGQTTHEEIQLCAKRIENQTAEVVRLAISGSSSVAGADAQRGRRSDGRIWKNRIDLDWRGFVEIKGGVVTDLALIGEGQESLLWDQIGGWPENEPDVAHLMAGRKVDLSGKVRYGVTGRPAAADEIGARSIAGLGTRVHLINLLGPGYRKILSGGTELEIEQQAQLELVFDAETQALVALLQTFQNTPADQRGRYLRTHRDGAVERIDAALVRVLGEDGFRAAVDNN
ncbi:MAG: hypothetical protein AAF585_13000 [Verrucomicrobiota bacterium]